MNQTLIPVPRGSCWVLLLTCGHVLGRNRYTSRMLCPLCAHWGTVRHTVAVRRILR